MKVRKIESTSKPKKFVPLNNGVWYYNYDITEKTVIVYDFEGSKQEELRYSFVQVRINGKPTFTKCYEAVLNVFKDDNGNTLRELLEEDNTYVNITEEILHNIKVDFGLELEISALEKAKNTLLKEIDNYDKSSNVNSFSLNGLNVWLPKDIRVGLMNSLTIEKNAGKEISTLWFGNIKLDINIEAAVQMLSALELYALECYNKTAEHKTIVESLTDEEQIKIYDYTKGYPEKLEFTI